MSEVKQIGNLTENTKRDNPQTYRVYDQRGISPTLNCMQGGNLQPMIIEPIIVASRGRNKENPSDRTPGNDVEQRLEPNSQGICNTITSVQKDNLVLEPAILCNKRTEYGKTIRKAYESGRVKESRHSMTELQPRDDGISNTLTTVQKDNLLLEPTVKIKQATKDGYIECKIGGVADLSFPNSATRRGRVQDNGDTCPTLTATETGICRIESLYRIRKLTPKECWRLMDFTDEDFEKAETVNSNSQLYKQAGNSIVKAVLMGIFGQMIQNNKHVDFVERI